MVLGLPRPMGPDWGALPREGVPRADDLAAHVPMLEVGLDYIDPQPDASERSSPVLLGVQVGDRRRGYEALPVEHLGRARVQPTPPGHYHQAQRALP